MISSADFWQYAGVFLALVVSAFGAPIPEELPIATGGVLVGQDWGKEDGLKWWIMLPLCIFGVVACDTILYLIGRKWGVWLAQRDWVQRRVLPPAKRARIEKNFEDYGIGILLVARLMPGIRTPVFITAGMTKLSFRKFLFADALYAIPGVNFFFWMAYWFTDSFMQIIHKIEDYRQLVVIAVVSFIAGFLAAYFAQRKVSTGDPKEIPVVGKTVAQISHRLHQGLLGSTTPHQTKDKVIVQVPPRSVAPVEYEKQVIILSAAKAVAVVQFLDGDSNTGTYRFRWQNVGSKNVIQGEGKFSEIASEPPTETLPPVLVEGGGCRLFVEAGDVKVEWCHGWPGMGYVFYDPESIRTYLADVSEFETVELTRFMK